jgi:CubicO group peptidase (beta-lactamase class C family)
MIRSRALSLLAVTGAVIVAGAWAATWALDVPDPIHLLLLATAQPSAIGALFPQRAIPASPHPIPLVTQDRPYPQSITWKGQKVTVPQFLQMTKTNAFLALRDGVLIKEWYADGIAATTPLASWSVAKSIVSLLVGQSIAAGRLQESDRVIDLLPRMRNAGLDPRITVSDLLDMTSGIDVPETYDAWRFWHGTTDMYLTQDLRQFVEQHVGLSSVPGRHGDYRSIDTQLLGDILVTIEGQHLANILSEGIWGPMGAQQAGSWNLDRPGGMEKAFCCINAVARDFARIGKLVLDEGRVDGRQVVPAEWIHRLETPAALPVDGLGYSAQWWQVPGPDDDVAAIGIYGQYVYVNRDRHVVIVKLSDYGVEEDELDTLEVLRSLSAWWDSPGTSAARPDGPGAPGTAR